MAITTYAELQSSVASWVARSTLTGIIPDLIMVGEKWVFRHARTREMETALSVAMVNGAAPVPSDYVALKHARIDGSPSAPLRMAPSTSIYARYPIRSSDSKPSFIAVDGANFVFGPFPDSTYTVLGIYYARLASIANSVTPFFLNNADIYLYATLAEAEPYLKNDKRLLVWKSKRDEILADMNGETREAQQDTGAEVTLG